MKQKYITKLLIIVVLILLTTAQGFAANSIEISSQTDTLQPREQTEISVAMIDQDGEIVTDDALVMIRVSEGTVIENKVLSQGLALEAGKGSFTYQAPDELGKIDILAIDLATNQSARYSIEISDQYTQADWSREEAVIKDITGNVVYQRADERNWQSAIAETELYAGDSIITWQNSWATLKLFDGSELILEPHTNVTIESLASLDTDSEVKRSRFKILSGSILSEVQGYLTEGARFEIETESAAAGVRGTFFEYVATPGGYNEVIVYTGSVNFYQRASGLSFNLNPGEAALLSKETIMPEVRRHEITKEERLKQVEEERKKASAEIIESEDDQDEDDETKTEPEESKTEDGQIDDLVQDPDIKESKLQEQEQERLDDSQEDEEDEDLRPEIDTETELPEEIEAEEPKRGDFNLEQTNLDLGSEIIDDQLYMRFSIQPEISNILGTNLSVGLDLPFYQDSAGDISFGSHKQDVKLNNLFNWIEYDGKYAYLKYGFMENITYGYGLLMGNYSKEDSRAIQLGFNDISQYNIGSRVLLPFDITSLYPWEVENTSSLYAARITRSFSADALFLELPFMLGTNYVLETNSDLEELDYELPLTGLSIDLALQLTELTEPYIELSTLPDFGSGAEVGMRGSLLSWLNYQSGFRLIGEEFVPNYFGSNYELYKENSLAGKPRGLAEINSANYPSNQGFYARANANILGLADFSLGYEDYLKSSQYAPILTSNLKADIPLTSLTAGYSYRQTKFNVSDANDLFLNQNTNFLWHFSYRLSSGPVVRVENKFIPSAEEQNFERNIKLSFSF